MKNALVLLLSFSLSACVEITDLDSPGKPAVPSQYQALAHPEPNHYSIVIPLAPGEVAFRKASSLSTAAVAPVLVLAQSQSQIVDDHVQAGEKYVYQIGSLMNGSLQQTRTVEVMVPLDRVFVAGEQVLTDDDLKSGTIYGRIFFAKGARVRTDGRDWFMRATRVVSDGGEIYSFPEGLTASVGENGRRGGHIQILVHDVIGILQITLRGEHGGKGRQGGDLKTRAAQGAPGQPGRGKFRPKSEAADEVCLQAAVSPGDGAPGVLKGNRGHDGGRGGDSGDVEIIVTGALAGGIHTNFYEGLGGLPGEGGLGERGGAPGEFDVSKNFQACDFRKAYEGPRGPQGEQGSSGPSGLRGTVCRVTGEGPRDCRQGI